MKKIIFSTLFVAVIFISGNAQSRPLILATYTYSTNDRLKNLQPLAEYLTQKTGLAFIAKSFPTVQALITAIRNDSVDIAMMNTSGYLVLQRYDPGLALPFVNLEMNSHVLTNYGGCLITRRETGISSLNDILLPGNKKILHLVNSSSTSGNLVPRLLLNKAGITDAESQFAVHYAGTHKNVVENVLNGNTTIGGCGCAEIDSARKHLSFDAKATVIDSFINIPLGPVIRNKKTDPLVVKAITRLFLSIHQDAPLVFQNFCDGWTEFKQAKRFKKIDDSEYDYFRTLFGNNDKLWKMIE